MPGVGVGAAVFGGLLPPILFGGVIGAGVGSFILYLGEIEAGNVPDEAGLLSDVKAHSVMEQPRQAQRAHDKVQPLAPTSLRGFAASRQ